MSSPESVALEGTEAAAEALDELILRARDGEERAYEEILLMFEGRALAIAHQMGASRADAEDIAQEAFLKLFRHVGSYKGGRRFTAWFYRIVVNAARDQFRKKGPATEEIPDGAGEPEAEQEVGPEGYRRIRAALLLLTEREREVVVLRDLHGLGTWEVARALGLNPITVRRHAQRARKRIRELLDL